jgi:hypothetical protein
MILTAVLKDDEGSPGFPSKLQNEIGLKASPFPWYSLRSAGPGERFGLWEGG